MSTKPEITIPDEAPPTELVLEDLVDGDGAEAVAGQPVEVRLDYRDAGVRLTVRNDLPADTGTSTGTSTGSGPGSGSGGAGLSTVNGGYGLTGMRERLKLLNGALEAGRSDEEREARATEHRLLFEAVRDGDAQSAADLMRRHVETSLGARSLDRLADPDQPR